MRQKVLVVEDEALIQRLISKTLSFLDLEALPATSLAEADRIFRKSCQELLIIVVDGCIESSDGPDTIPFVQKVREVFAGPIVAISASEINNQQLMDSGCTHYGTKPNILDSILDAIRDAKSALPN